MTPHNKRLKSPLRVSQTLICPITPEENELPDNSLESLSFDARHDFLIDDYFTGIAIKIDLFNARAQAFQPTGLRRNGTEYSFDNAYIKYLKLIPDELLPDIDE